MGREVLFFEICVLKNDPGPERNISTKPARGQGGAKPSLVDRSQASEGNAKRARAGRASFDRPAS